MLLSHRIQPHTQINDPVGIVEMRGMGNQVQSQHGALGLQDRHSGFCAKRRGAKMRPVCRDRYDIRVFHGGSVTGGRKGVIRNLRSFVQYE